MSINTNKTNAKPQTLPKPSLSGARPGNNGSTADNRERRTDREDKGHHDTTATPDRRGGEEDRGGGGAGRGGRGGGAAGGGIGGPGGGGLVAKLKKDLNLESKLQEKKQFKIQRTRWSYPMPLQEAVEKVPVVIRLEEGHRGQSEELSLSAGETMAMEGVIQHRGGRVVMTYHVRERQERNEEEEEGNAEREEEEEEDEEEERFFRLLPCDNLPEVEVCVLEDCNGQAFADYLTCHFSNYNWTQQRKELLDKMGDDSYINVSSIVTPHHHPPSPPPMAKEQWTLQTTRRPPPPPPSLPKAPGHSTAPPPSHSPGGGKGEGGGERTPPPPPRPPKGHRRPSPSDFAPPPSPSLAPSPSSLPYAPPRPPRKSPDDRPAAPLPGSDPPSGGERWEEEEMEEEGGGAGFGMPTFAELFSGASFQLNMESSTDTHDVLLPEKVPSDKDKKKTSALKKMKTLGTKLYAGMSKVMPRQPPSSSSSSQEGGGTDTPTTPTSPSVEEEEEDDDEQEYTMIDESMMDPVFDPPSRSAGKTHGRKGKQRDGEGKAKKAAVLKPVLRVEPSVTSSHAVTSQATSSTTSRAQGDKRPPLMSQQSASLSKGDKRPLMTSQQTAPVSKVAPTVGKSHSFQVPKMVVQSSVPGEPSSKTAEDLPKMVTCPLQDMTCSDLCARFRQCGMPGLAKVCQSKSLDGLFFCSLSDEALKQPPFSLDSFEVDTKLKMVKAGWVPR